MRDDPKVRAAKTEVRERERAIWTTAEREGRAMRQAATSKAVVSQVDRDVTNDRPKQGFGT